MGTTKCASTARGRSRQSSSIYGCKEGELVAIYSSFPAELKCFKGLARRWDLRDEIAALDDLSDEEDENFSRKDEVRARSTQRSVVGEDNFFCAV